jgi:hypothetical protein
MGLPLAETPAGRRGDQGQVCRAVVWEARGMERGSAKHGPREDEALAAQLRGKLGSAGGHREEWVDPEPPADDDPPIRRDREELDSERGEPTAGTERG